MRTDEVYKLLDAFYNGDTTVEQEQELLDFFSREDVSGDLLDEKEIFLSMYRSDPVEVPSDLESKLGSLIDELANEERKLIEKRHQQTKRRAFVWVGSAAACITLLISVTFYFNNKPEINRTPVANDQAIENLSEADKKALKEAEEALILLSSNFNKGVNQLAVVSSSFDKTNELLNKTINRKKDKES